MRRIALSFGKGAPLLAGVMCVVWGCSDFHCVDPPRRFEVTLTGALQVRARLDGQSGTYECGIVPEDWPALTLEISPMKDNEDRTSQGGGQSCRVGHVEMRGNGMDPAGTAHYEDISLGRGIAGGPILVRAAGFHEPLAMGRVSVDGGNEYIVGAACPSDLGQICVWEQPEADGAMGALLFVLAGSDPPCAQAFEVELL